MMFALYDTTAGADDDGIAHMCGHVFEGSVIQERRRKWCPLVPSMTEQ